MARRYTTLTARGRCLLAAGLAAAACAVGLDERDLLRVAVFALALPLLALPYARLLRSGVTAHRELPSAEVTAGEETPVRLHVHTRGGVGGELTLCEALPDTLGGSRRFRLPTAARRAAAGQPLDYVIRRPVRGAHHLGPLSLTAGDPLGLARSRARVGPPSSLLVVPAVTALAPGIPRHGSGTHGDTAAPAPAGSGEPDMVVREYRHGDDVRKVHWPSTARHDELMVRTEEPLPGGRVTVLLDHRGSAHGSSGAAGSLEWAVSFAASVCARLGQSGKRFRLVGTDRTVLAEEGAPRGKPGSEALLATLARLPHTLEPELYCPNEPSRCVIAVLGACGHTDAEALVSSRGAKAGGLAVLLDVPGTRGSQTGEPVLLGAGWHVVRAGPEADPARVWRELLGAGTREARAPAGRR
jgi:uncharacterized protein (DUF58 family)